MSTHKAQDVIRNSKLFHCGYQITPGIARGLLASNDIQVSRERAEEVLQEMARAGELKPSHKGYRKASQAGEWIRRAWRFRTDEQVGIV